MRFNFNNCQSPPVIMRIAGLVKTAKLNRLNDSKIIIIIFIMIHNNMSIILLLLLLLLLIHHCQAFNRGQIIKGKLFKLKPFFLIFMKI